MKKVSNRAKKTKVTKKVAGSRAKSPLPKIVLALGILLGGAMIGMGIYKNLNSEYDAFHIKTEEELKSDVSDKIKELDGLKEKREKVFDESAISEEYTELSREISIKEGELLDTEAELANVHNGFYDNMKQDKVWGSVPLIVLGAVVIVFALGLFMRMNSSSKRNVILTVSEEK